MDAPPCRPSTRYEEAVRVPQQISTTIFSLADFFATLLAVGSFQSREAKSFHGRAMAILRSTGKAGTVRVEARADGLVGGSVRIRLA